MSWSINQVLLLWSSSSEILGLFISLVMFCLPILIEKGLCLSSIMNANGLCHRFKGTCFYYFSLRHCEHIYFLEFYHDNWMNSWPWEVWRQLLLSESLFHVGQRLMNVLLFYKWHDCSTQDSTGFCRNLLALLIMLSIPTGGWDVSHG